jgi:pre-mRNA-splicing helicase BRR2
VACGVSLANARDLGEWIGAPSHAIFNFSPSARPLDMDIHLQSFQIAHFPSLMIAMSKPAYLAIVEYSPTKPIIAFVPSRRQCRLTVDDILTHCAADDKPDRFLNLELEELQLHLDHLSDKALAETLKHGIGYYHEALSKQDKLIVHRLFESGAIQVLVASMVRYIIYFRVTLDVLLMTRTLHGVSPSHVTWLSSWEFSSTKGRNIDMSTTL